MSIHRRPASLPARALALATTLAVTLAWLVAPTAGPAHALDQDLLLAVTTTDDGSLDDAGFACPAEDDDECSLRGAVEAASDASTAGVGSITIEVPVDTYTLDHDDGQLELDTDVPVTLVGVSEDDPVLGDDGIIEAASTAVVDADENSRILEVVGEADLTVERLSLVNGDAGNGAGAAIWIAPSGPAGDLTVRDSRIEGNRGGAGGGSGGAIGWSQGAVDVVDSLLADNELDSISASGGAISSSNEITITDSVLAGNRSGTDGGAISGLGASEVTITDSRLEANTADDGAGGAIRATTVTITGSSTLADNSAVEHGGALQSNSSNADFTIGPDVVVEGNSAGERGGAVHVAAGSVTVDGATLRDNTADGGGAIATDTGHVTVQGDSLLEGNRARTTAGGGAILADSRDATGTAGVIVADSILRDNSSPGSGGAVSIDDGNLDVERSTFENNRSTFNNGGAIALRNAAGGVIDQSTIVDNDATTFGGGITVSNAVLALTRSTLQGNEVTNGHGGGLLATGSSADIAVANTTVSGNRARSSGGGISASTGGSIELDSVTVADNALTGSGDDVDDGAGLGADFGGTIELTNTLVADNAGHDQCWVGPSNDPEITSLGHNLDSDGTCGLDESEGDVPEGDADLSDLADNGGQTLTHALGAASDARATGATGLDVDQRGVTRPQGDDPDIGAVEMVDLPGGCTWAWTGAVSDSWHDADNWDGPPGTPGGPDDTVCLDEATNLPVVHDDGETTIGSLSNSVDLDGVGLRLEGGTLTLNDDSELAHLGLALADDAAALVVDADLDVAGGSSFAQGTLSGDGLTTFGGGLVVDEPGAKNVDGHHVRLEATTTMSSDNPVRLTGDSTVTNAGTVLLEGGAAFSQLVNQFTNEVVNDGTIRKTGSGQTLTTATLRNGADGRVEVEEGTLRLTSGGDSDGTFTIADGATVTFVGEVNPAAPGSSSVAFVHNPGSTVTGEGTAEAAGIPGFRIAGTYDVGSTRVQGLGALASTSLSLMATADATTGQLTTGFAFINGPGELQVTGDYRMLGGTSLTQGVTFEVGGDLDVDGSGNRTLFQASRIDVAGAATQIDGQVRLTADSEIDVDGRYDHTGGRLVLQDATVRADDLDLSGDAELAGTGTVDAEIDNAGLVSPGTSPGMIDVDGAFVQDADGTFEVELAGTDDAAFDRVIVDGDAVLDGTLDVTLLGDFVPSEGDEFAILTADTITGTFAQERLPDLDGEGDLEVDYRGDAVVLVVPAGDDPPPPPEPGAIDGTVTDADTDETIAFAAVTTIDADGRGVGTLADADGGYGFDDLEAGTYTVRGSANGYQTTTVTEVEVVEGATTTVDLALAPEVDDDPPPPPPEEDLEACPEGRVPPSGFADVVGNVHEAAIDCAAWHELTEGVDATTYLPAGDVTRAQMASFVARTIEAAGGQLPEVDDDVFDDIAGSTHADRINQLATVGVVQGRTAERYDPRDPMTRAQTAALLVRAYGFVTGEALPAPAGPFTDIAGLVHEADIDAAFAARLTEGQTATTFEPGATTRRDQMASFLTRLLDRLAADGRVELPDA